MPVRAGARCGHPLAMCPGRDNHRLQDGGARPGRVDDHAAPLVTGISPTLLWHVDEAGWNVLGHFMSSPELTVACSSSFEQNDGAAITGWDDAPPGYVAYAGPGHAGPDPDGGWPPGPPVAPPDPRTPGWVNAAFSLIECGRCRIHPAEEPSRTPGNAFPQGRARGQTLSTTSQN
jgi:hypothetical protein